MVTGMECEFSEFSYGYAAIREAEAELTQVYQSAGAPVLPSLLQEEKLGWDAHLEFVDYALFLQFKRVDFVSRRHPDSPSWDHVAGKHYRFAIDTDGHQHAALCELERNLASFAVPAHVYYAAPTFYRQIEFDMAYGGGTVLEQSSLIAPTALGENDGRHHHVTDEAGVSLILSEPRRVESAMSWEAMLAGARDRAGVAREGRREGVMTLGDLEGVLRVSAERLGRSRYVSLDAPLARRLDRLAAALDCGLVR